MHLPDRPFRWLIATIVRFWILVFAVGGAGALLNGEMGIAMIGLTPMGLYLFYLVVRGYLAGVEWRPADIVSR